MVSGSTSARQFLLRPGEYFETHDPEETLPWAAGAVLVCIVVGFIFVYLVGKLIVNAIEGPVYVDNPAYPGDAFCDGPTNSEENFQHGCDEPRQIKRSPEAVVNDALTPFYGYILIGILLFWASGTMLFYGTAQLAGGSPNLPGTVAVAGWLAVPEIVRFVAGFVALRYALADVTITNVEADVILEAINSVGSPLLVVTLVITAWQWYIATGGMAAEAELDKLAAIVATGLPLLIAFLLAAP